MSRPRFPCGACKVLRRRCNPSCVFAPYFLYEDTSNQFSVIHQVFGASNASKILSQLPVSDRFGAAITLTMEALARLQDPVYGCVSHIFALEHQVIGLHQQIVDLQAHVVLL